MWNFTLYFSVREVTSADAWMSAARALTSAFKEQIKLYSKMALADDARTQCVAGGPDRQRHQSRITVCGNCLQNKTFLQTNFCFFSKNLV